MNKTIQAYIYKADFGYFARLGKKGMFGQRLPFRGYFLTLNGAKKAIEAESKNYQITLT